MRLIVSLGRKCWREDGRKNIEEDSIVEVEGSVPKFSYKELFDLTGGFSDESQLGKGGWGIVYKAKLKSGIEVAIKRMKLAAIPSQVMKAFKSEIIIISQIRHRNLIKLLGYCHDPSRNEHLLVYDLAPNGNLEDVLFTSARRLTSLAWPQKLKILAGAADGLDYLHEGLDKKIIHRDIKCANILLDEEWNAKLGDFGLSRAADHQGEAAATDIAYTPGYIAPEIMKLLAEGKSSFSDKSDIFAFGVVILEVACGRRVAPRPYPNDIYLVELVRRAYSKGDLLSTVENGQGYYNAEQMKIVLEVGFLCVQHIPEDRPSMRTVAETLRKILGGDVGIPHKSKPTTVSVPDKRKPTNVSIPLWQLSNEAPGATAEKTRQCYGAPSPPPSFAAATKVTKDPHFQHFQQPPSPPPCSTAAPKVTEKPHVKHFQQPPLSRPCFTAAPKVTENPHVEHFQQPSLSRPGFTAAPKNPRVEHFQQPPLSRPRFTAAPKNPHVEHFQQPPPLSQPCFTAAPKVTENPHVEHFQQPSLSRPCFTAAPKVTESPHVEHFQQLPLSQPWFTSAAEVAENPRFQHFQQPPPWFTAATVLTENPPVQHIPQWNAFQNPTENPVMSQSWFTAAPEVAENPCFQHFQQPPPWFTPATVLTENPPVQYVPQWNAFQNPTENPLVQHVQQWNAFQDPMNFRVPQSPEPMIVSFLRQYRNDAVARALQRLKYGSRQQ